MASTMAMARIDLTSAAGKVERMIVHLRGQGVILDNDLASSTECRQRMAQAELECVGTEVRRPIQGRLQRDSEAHGTADR